VPHRVHGCVYRNHHPTTPRLEFSGAFAKAKAFRVALGGDHEQERAQARCYAGTG